MNIKALKALVAAAIVLSAVQLNTNTAFARQECIKQYGGGETCIDIENGDLEVNKKILNPRTDDYEDHIKPSGGSNPYTFTANERIEFSIVVKNVGDIRIEDIELEDILPSFVKYRSGDGDGKDGDTKVEFDEFDLDPGEEKEFEFTAKVESDGVLPKDDRICVTNIAKAEGKLEESNDEVDDADYANFCIELPKVKGKEAPKQLPKTGGFISEDNQQVANLILAGSISAGLVLVGFGLKKIAD